MNGSKVKDAAILDLIIATPELSIAQLAGKLAMTPSKLRYWIGIYKRVGILKHEGSRNKGRWVVTPEYGGCDADGRALVKMNLELDPGLEAKIQKWADARELSLEEAAALLIREMVDKMKTQPVIARHIAK